ncbi:hypothetical protein [Bacillus sp. FJAT-27264]|uniref:hypothetical protein n=1 Tax=Paenibacillus sp. (strain DSM 101736 / FJAT-27264) TaxID=1850362 RepID=UPI0009F32C94|nr:hypothetical protein [Bacillus sp. FJAT-27264]
MKIILVDTQGKVTPAGSKSHIVYRFFVPNGAERLAVHFTYGPKYLEDQEKARLLIEQGIDTYFEAEYLEQAKARWQSYLPLQNLITVSVDAPDGHRGAAHRHDREQLHILSRHEATPGLVQGEIIPGMWEVTLSLHAIVTDVCDYTLKVWLEEEGTQ